ncbi:Uncharacterized domain DM10 and Protein of unknown function DUF1126 repeat-containing protein [Aphelenchoides besseyi]|nr:Uncharacterized domain DM10 and Protein of unknown function DUF1126 repeat-containing protein [Aphelenchoides besseyi]
MFDSPRSMEHANCDCFSDDSTFFIRSFNRPKPKPQVLTKVGDESFFKLSKKMPPTWEPRTSAAPEFFDPLHKANLCFYLYLNETDGVEGELLKIRPMKLTYHLDDETISLFEPHSTNSGHLQGRMFTRQKVPRQNKRVGEEHLTWKDIKIGHDINLFGKNYRVVACDDFTKSFLEDRGHPVGKIEQFPTDAWNVFKHFRPQQIFRDIESPSRLLQQEETEKISWETAPQLLLFHVAWLDSKNDFHGTKVKRTFRMSACPDDDTVTLNETTLGYGNGFEHPLFLKASRLPYLTRDRFPRYYRVRNFRPGIWIEVFKRPMYIYDCEGEATREFMRQQYGESSFGDCPLSVLEKGPPIEQFETLPTQLVFKATNSEFPATNFLIFYYLNHRRLDIFEVSRLRDWSKGRTFLLDIDVSHLELKTFVPNAKLKVFKWEFVLGEPHPDTLRFLNSLQQKPTDIESSAFADWDVDDL